MYELYHHGILGQRWGKKNGPPYPLGVSDHSASEKKAGWRKSLDKSVNKLASSSSSAYTAHQKRKKITEDYVKDLWGGIKTIDENTEVIPKGITFNRVAGDEKIDSLRKYVSLESSQDSNEYENVAQILPIKGNTAYEYTYKAKKDLKVATEKQVRDYIIEKYGDTKLKDLSTDDMSFHMLSKKGQDTATKLLRKMKNISIEDLYKNQNQYEAARSGLSENRHLEDKNRKAAAASIIADESFRLFFNKHLMDMSENRDAIFSEFKNRGYDAIVDVEDKQVGFDYPLIILDPKQSLSMVSKKSFNRYAGMNPYYVRENPHKEVMGKRIDSLNASGMTNAEIANKLDISESTVIRYISRRNWHL